MLKIIIFVFIAIAVIGIFPRIIASLLRKKKDYPVKQSSRYSKRTVFENKKVNGKNYYLSERITRKPKKRKISAWSLFAGEQAKRGKTFKEAAELWKQQKTKK